MAAWTVPIAARVVPEETMTAAGALEEMTSASWRAAGADVSQSAPVRGQDALTEALDVGGRSRRQNIGDSRHELMSGSANAYKSRARRSISLTAGLVAAFVR